jgi:hypothetical protein
MMALFNHIMYFIHGCDTIGAIRKSNTKAKTKPLFGSKFDTQNHYVVEHFGAQIWKDQN